MTPEKIRAAYRQHGTLRATAAALGITLHQVRKAVASNETGEVFENTKEGDNGKILSITKKVITIDDAIAKGGYDLDVWECVKSKAGAWTVTTKNNDGKGEPHEMWKIEVQMHRRVSEAQEIALRGVLDEIAKAAPKYPRLARRRKVEGLLGEMSIADHHFGMLAWKPETGENYDLQIAAKRYRDACQFFVAEFAHRNVDQILCVIGNDGMHADNARGTTTKGTPLDVDGRFAKSFNTAFSCMHFQISLAAQVAPVHVVMVPGNHDGERSYYLAFALAQAFANTPHVTFDVAPDKVKYFRWGLNLFGLTHGDGTRKDIIRLTGLMAQERKQDWAETRWREWHMGHFHTDQSGETQTGDVFQGVRYRRFPSLVGRDAYHRACNYTGLKESLGLFFSRNDGPIGTALYSCPMEVAA